MNKEDSSGESKSQDASSPDTLTDAPSKYPNAEIYENRGPKKIIRVVTVMAYLFSVSFVGILLSAYYIFLWEPPNPRFLLRERLRTDPQMQFLVAPSSEETDLTKKDSSSLLQSEVSHAYKPLLGRMTHDTYDSPIVDPRDKMNFEKKRRLSTLLLKLRHSLVDAQNQNSSQEAAIFNGLNNSFVRVEKVLNSTKTMDRAENISERKIHSDNAELADSISMLDVESTSSTSKFMTIPEIQTSQSHFDRDSVTDANPMPITEEKNWYRKKKLDAIESYPVRGFSKATTNGDVTSGSDRRPFEDNNSSKVVQEFPKIDAFDDRKESMRQNENEDHWLTNNNDLADIQTDATSEDHVNAGVKNSPQNYSSDNESYSNDQTEEIARDRISIDSSSRDSEFTDEPEFHQTPDDPTVVKSRSHATGTRDFEETQIERMTARSTMIDNKQLKQMDLSTSQRHENFSETTEIIDMEETSVEFTSMSTMRDYRNNFTNITNEDDDSVT